MVVTVFIACFPFLVSLPLATFAFRYVCLVCALTTTVPLKPSLSAFAYGTSVPILTTPPELLVILMLRRRRPDLIIKALPRPVLPFRFAQGIYLSETQPLKRKRSKKKFTAVLPIIPGKYKAIRLIRACVSLRLNIDAIKFPIFAKDSEERADMYICVVVAESFFILLRQ